jgi:hypothetical protein
MEIPVSLRPELTVRSSAALVVSNMIGTGTLNNYVLDHGFLPIGQPY